MTTRPEALRLAEELAAWEFSSSGLCVKSAAELRRLHNEILVYHDDRLKLSNEVDRLKAALGLIASLGHRPADEPVAWRYRGIFHEFDPSDWAEGPVTPLYTTPPAAQRQWVGLTDAEVMQTMSGDWTSQFYFARAIEAKLKELNT